MILPGKKYKQWVIDRAEIIKRGVLENKIVISESGNIFGRCWDCQRWLELAPDHRQKRSQGGTNDYENIDWVCWQCHHKRDNMGDPKNKKTKKLKAAWMKTHKCQHCGVSGAQLLCRSCGRISAPIRGDSI